MTRYFDMIGSNKTGMRDDIGSKNGFQI